MLRKRTRSHQMGDAVLESFSYSDILRQNHNAKSIFNIPGLFIGLNPKVSESDSVRSPTSPLDFRVFSNLGSPFRSPRSNNDKHHKSWDCSKVGLSIIDSLDDDDEAKKSEKILRASASKNVLFGPHIRIKNPNFPNLPMSLPKPSNLQKGGADFSFGKGKVASCSLDSGKLGLNLANFTNYRTNSSSDKFCSENVENPISQFTHFIGGSPNSSNSSSAKPVSIPNGKSFIGPLTASEIELSEDYTCIRMHGPNPKTTHIFGDCILECHHEFTNSCKNEQQEVELPQSDDCILEEIETLPTDDFLSFCYSCKKKLDGEDIYMYRGEKAFCSCSCRLEEILIEEAMEKAKNVSLANCEELFETSLFIAE